MAPRALRQYPRNAHIVELGEQSHNTGVLLDGSMEEFLYDEKACYTLPYSRTGLADFLCVDRSALSRELCRMRDEGVLDFSGSKLRLLDPDFLRR